MIIANLLNCGPYPNSYKMLLLLSGFAILISALGIAIFKVPFLIVIFSLVIFGLGIFHTPFLFCFFIFICPFVIHWFHSAIGKFEEFFVLLIIITWVFRIFLRGKAYSEISKFLILFPVAVLVISLASALHNGLSYGDIRTCAMLGMFYIFVYSIYDIYKIRDTTLIWLFATLPVVVGSLMQLNMILSAGNIFSMIYILRFKPSAFSQNTNVFSAEIITILPFWISLGLWSTRNKIRYLSVVFSIILFLGLAVSNARSALLGFAICIIVFFIKAKKLKYFLSFLFIVILIIFLVPAFGRLIFVIFRFDYGTSFRNEVWKFSLDMFRHNPLLGIGFDNFKGTIYKYLYNPELRQNVQMLFHAHNFILNTMVAFGIPGLIIAFGFYIKSILIGIKAIRPSSNRELDTMAFGIFAGMIAHLGWTIFESGWIISVDWPYPIVLFWMAIIMLIKISKLKGKQTYATLNELNM